MEAVEPDDSDMPSRAVNCCHGLCNHKHSHNAI